MMVARVDASVLDRFVDALWLEDGLSANTLAAYRSDLSQFDAWLRGQRAVAEATPVPGALLLQVLDADVLDYMASRLPGSRATSSNRRLTVFKRFYRWALREGLVALDPTLKLLSAKTLLRVPKTLTETQVERLLQAPDLSTPLGLRDRAISRTKLNSLIR